METIKQILMRRDNMTANEAQDLINEASNELQNKLMNGDDLEDCFYICEEFFSLEPDYIMELI